MASTWYKSGIVEMMRGNIDLVNDVLIGVAVSPEYVPNFETDQNQNDLPTASQLGEALLTGKSLDGTALLADTLVFPTVSGNVGGIVLVRDSGDYDTSTLVAYIESDNFPAAISGPLNFSWAGSGVVAL
jgi:hypothetical protein